MSFIVSLITVAVTGCPCERFRMRQSCLSQGHDKVKAVILVSSHPSNIAKINAQSVSRSIVVLLLGYRKTQSISHIKFSVFGKGNVVGTYSNFISLTCAGVRSAINTAHEQSGDTKTNAPRRQCTFLSKVVLKN